MQKPGTPVTSINKSSGSAVIATQNSVKINAGNYANAIGYLTVTAHSGTTPTLDVKFQDSSDGTNWVDVPSGAFAQVTTAHATTRVVLTNVGPYLRAVQTLGGTTPSYNYDLSVGGVG